MIVDEEYKWVNFDYDWYIFPAEICLDEYLSSGGTDTFSMIEAVDGFHPA